MTFVIIILIITSWLLFGKASAELLIGNASDPKLLYFYPDVDHPYKEEVEKINNTNKFYIIIAGYITLLIILSIIIYISIKKFIKYLKHKFF